MLPARSHAAARANGKTIITRIPSSLWHQYVHELSAADGRITHTFGGGSQKARSVDGKLSFSFPCTVQTWWYRTVSAITCTGSRTPASVGKRKKEVADRLRPLPHRRRRRSQLLRLPQLYMLVTGIFLFSPCKVVTLIAR